MEHLIEPHGGELVDLIVDSAAANQLKESSKDWPSWDLTPRQICDLELLLNGAFSPLRGFMTTADYDSVCKDMRLADKTLWPMPITLDVDESFAQSLEVGGKLALRDPEGVMLAVLHVEDVWQPDREAEAKAVFGSNDTKHPAVNYLLKQSNSHYVGGRLEGIQLPTHYDCRSLRETPADCRREFSKLGWKKIVAFQTRNPMHRAHHELTLRAAKEIGANLLIHPVVGLTKPGDLDHYTRVHCYEAILKRYPAQTARLSLLPLAMRMGGPREAVWHAIIRKNFGCTHLIVGRDHAGPGSDSSGEPFYGPYDAQEMMKKYEEEIGVAMVPFKLMVYAEDHGSYYPIDDVPEGARVLNISGTELRQRLAEGRELPEWFTFPRSPAHFSNVILHGPGRGSRSSSVDSRVPASRRLPTCCSSNSSSWGAPGNVARWRYRSHEPLLGVGFFQGTPRYQYPSYRLCGIGDHEERRYRSLCADRSL